MRFTYALQILDEHLDLFQSNNVHFSEESLISEMEKSLSGNQLHLLKIQIQLLFNKFDTINHESHIWSDNLKTLLAHGFTVINKISNITLKKSYEPIIFLLFSEKTQESHHFGYFYSFRHVNLGEQFIHFIKNTEYPPKISEHIILSVLLKDGGYLFVREPQRDTILIKCNPVTKTLTGYENLLLFFSTPIKQHAG